MAGGKTDNKSTEKKVTLSARLFRKMQTKFTALVAVVCSVLVTVAFVAMMIVNTVALNVSVNEIMNDAIREVISNSLLPDQGESEDMPRPDCLIVVESGDETYEFGSLGPEVGTLSRESMNELKSAAIRGETSVRLDDLIVRVSMRTDVPREGDAVFVYYDFTDRYSLYVTQTLGMLFSFVGLTIILVVFSYMMSGVLLAPARDALVRQKDLVANASHELKTPITIINANLDVIKNSPDGADNSKWIANIEAQTKRMNSLIIELLEMSSFESDAYKPELTEFDLGEIAEGACLTFEAACYEKGISVDYESDGDTVIRSDEKGWTKLVGILLDNAVKYSPERGRISVRLERKKRRIVFSVGNDGEIPADKKDRIFDRFYKGGDAAGSFGLGLAMAKVITGGMNGDISVASADGRTVFTVSVPVGKEQKDSENADVREERKDG